MASEFLYNLMKETERGGGGGEKETSQLIGT